MKDDFPKVQVFMFDDGPKEIPNCSWDELRQVIDYLAAENQRLHDDYHRRNITVPRTVRVEYVAPRGLGCALAVSLWANIILGGWLLLG